MGIANSKGFPLQLDRTIVDMYYDQFTQQKPLWPSIFKKGKAPKGPDYTRADLSGLGPNLREAGEGEAVEYAIPLEGNKVQRFYKVYQLGFQVTEIMLEDELFDKMKNMSAGLAKAAQFTIEAKAWALFNGAFGTTVTTGKDGKALIVNNHTTLAGKTISNLIAGDLDTTTLQQMIEYFQTLYAEDDTPITEYLKTLVVPMSELWKANELLKSTGRVWDSGSMMTGTYGPVGDRSKPAMNAGLNNQGTAGYPSYEAMNLLNPSAGVVQGWNIVPVRYLTDSDAYFGLSGNFDGEILFKRDPIMQSADDVTTGNRLYRTSTRFLPHIEEFRFMCGSAGV